MSLFFYRCVSIQRGPNQFEASGEDAAALIESKLRQRVDIFSVFGGRAAA